MTKWFQWDRTSFEMAYNRSNYAGAVFSAIKEGTGTMVRARPLAMQTVELFARVLR